MDAASRFALYLIPTLAVAIVALAVALKRVRRLLKLKDCRMRTHDLRRTVAILIHAIEEYSVEVDRAVAACGKGCAGRKPTLDALRKDLDEAEELLRSEVDSLDARQQR